MEDASVFSVQWSIFPAGIAAGLTADLLLQRYQDYIRHFTFGIIRPVQEPHGVEFRLGGSGLSLISFLPPLPSAESTALQICGGILVQPRQCRRGELHFSVVPGEEGTKVELRLSDFCPLILGSPSPSPIRRWLYRLTQALIHRLVTVRFLILLHRERSGRRTAVRVVRVSVREGRPT
ncbi:hypothetical protein GSVR_06840 [Geobacter sp. SVR]|nr:hypothetical protein GSVR_06840 [Geobacter sp. SVR]